MHNNVGLTHIPKQSPLSARIDDVVARYGNDADLFFQSTFSPVHIDRYSANPMRMVNGTAPSLNLSADAFGETPLVQWLALLLVHLSEYMGCKQKMTPYQMERLARNIYKEYGYLKVTEIMLFINYAERGRLGSLAYGVFDPIRIMQLLGEFVVTYRADYIDRYEQAKREEERKAHDRCAIPPPPEILKRHKEIIDKFNLAKLTP